MSDPLIDAVVQHIAEDAKKQLQEGHSNLNEFLKATVEEARGYHVTDALQVASSLVYSCGKRIQKDDSKTADKLFQMQRQLDRIADEY